MTQTMREFLTAWLAWAEDAADASDGIQFKKRTGLCSNITVFVGDFGEYYPLLNELHSMLSFDGLNVTYPFDTEDSYELAFASRTQHLNPARLAWVRAKLESDDE